MSLRAPNSGLAQAYPQRRHWAEILVDPLMREPKRRLKQPSPPNNCAERHRFAPPWSINHPPKDSQHRNSNKQSRQRYAANGFARAFLVAQFVAVPASSSPYMRATRFMRRK